MVPKPFPKPLYVLFCDLSVHGNGPYLTIRQASREKIMTTCVWKTTCPVDKFIPMGSYLRPLETEIFLMIENRRERLGYDHVTNFYSWALSKDPESAYRQYYRLKKTAEGEAPATERANLSIEDASNLARALQMDLSDMIRKAEQKLGLDEKPFPVPSKPSLSKGKKTA
jgi:hypothetical protein